MRTSRRYGRHHCHRGLEADTDLLMRGGETFAGSPLLPWVSKIDWMLETILKSLVKSHPGSVAIARLTDVDISAGGVGFIRHADSEAG